MGHLTNRVIAQSLIDDLLGGLSTARAVISQGGADIGLELRTLAKRRSSLITDATERLLPDLSDSTIGKISAEPLTKQMFSIKAQPKIHAVSASKPNSVDRVFALFGNEQASAVIEHYDVLASTTLAELRIELREHLESLVPTSDELSGIAAIDIEMRTLREHRDICYEQMRSLDTKFSTLYRLSKIIETTDAPEHVLHHLRENVKRLEDMRLKLRTNHPRELTVMEWSVWIVDDLKQLGLRITE